MKFFAKKLLLLTIAGVLVGNAGTILAQSSDFQVIDLTHNLQNTTQQIKKVIFALPNSNGGLQLSTGTVEITTHNEKVSIDGSLLTNATERNIISGTSTNVSIIGGKNNIIHSGDETTLIGGSGNTISSTQAFIWGGEQNVVLPWSSRSSILGGKENSLQGETSTILWGIKNILTGQSSVIMGNYNHISGVNSLAAGSGVHIQSSQTFARSDGQSFELRWATGSNLFAIKAANGVAIHTETPHPRAALTVDGDLRVQEQARFTGDTKTAGVVRTISSDTLCPCFHNGTEWQPMVGTPKCKNACK